MHRRRADAQIRTGWDMKGITIRVNDTTHEYLRQEALRRSIKDEQNVSVAALVRGLLMDTYPALDAVPAQYPKQVVKRTTEG